MKDSLILGIDGGGTQTRALLVGGDGTVLGRGLAGASNLNTLGVEGALREVKRAVLAAFEQAGLEPRAADAFFSAQAGALSSGLALPFAEALCEAGLARPGAVAVDSDIEAALMGGLSGRPGIALIAGTGSVAFGRNESGAQARCGGGGWILDELGGGAGLGREGLRAVLRAADGRGPRTLLSQKLQVVTGAQAPEEITRWLHAHASMPQTLATLAPSVVEAAESGDVVAQGILKRGAEELSLMAGQVQTRLHMDGFVELVLVGSLANSGAPYQTMIEEALLGKMPRCRITAPEMSAEAGAVLCSFKQSAKGPSPEFVAHLQRSERAR